MLKIVGISVTVLLLGVVGLALRKPDTYAVEQA